MSEYTSEYSSDGGSELLPAPETATGSATPSNRATRPADATGPIGPVLPRDALIARLKRLLGMKGTQQQLTDKLATMNETVKARKARHASLREGIILELGGPDVVARTKCKFQHVTLKQLVRMKYQPAVSASGKVSFATTLAARVAKSGYADRTTSGVATVGDFSLEDAPLDANSRRTGRAQPEGSLADASSPNDYNDEFDPGSSAEVSNKPSAVSLTSESRIAKIEQSIKALKAKIARLSEEEQYLLEQMSAVHGVTAQIDTLHRQADTFNNNFERERELRLRAEDDKLGVQAKIDALQDHIEKLMTHLKHEAAAKAKAIEASKRAERELALLRSRNSALSKKNSAREQVITELKEGTRILEDQLRLMDEKYIDLRGKLDWARSQSQKKVTKILSQTARLESKWSLLQAAKPEEAWQ